jgi:tripartite-type tricarboxylate transporter receptor subunit TctC
MQFHRYVSFRRRSVIAATLATLLFASAFAQGYPSQPIRLVVPFAAVGTTDLLGRLVAEGLHKRLDQAVVVDNKAGAGANIGSAEVARAKPDGHTLLMATPGPLAINQYVYANPGFDAEKQLTGVSLVAIVPNVLLASSKSGIRNMAELLARAKASPGRLNYGSAGNGSTSHLAGELVKSMAKVSMTHIPYRGVAPAMNDLIAGQIDVMFDNLPTAMPMIESGKVIPLGVTTASRVTTLPNVPSIATSIPGFELNSWFGIAAPAGTPPPVLNKLAAEIDALLKLDANKERLGKMGAIPVGGTPDEFNRLIRTEQQRFGELVKRAGITPQ